MRTHSYIPGFFFVMFLVTMMGAGCKKSALLTYDTSNSIYFHNLTDAFGNVDSARDFTFAYEDSAMKDTVIRVALRVTGLPADHDRKFSIAVDGASTAVEGRDFEKLAASYTLPAGMIDDTIAVRLLRSAELLQNRVTLVLALQPGDDFTTHLANQGMYDDGTVISYLKYRISFSDILTEPAGWTLEFGLFSPKKMRIVAELAGIDASWLNFGDDEYPLNSNAYRYRTYYFIELLNAYLSEMAAAGTPVYYEDGTLMVTTDY